MHWMVTLVLQLERYTDHEQLLPHVSLGAALPAALLCAQLQCVAGTDDPRVPRVCVRRVGGGPDQGADQGMARRPRPRGCCRRRSRLLAHAHARRWITVVVLAHALVLAASAATAHASKPEPRAMRQTKLALISHPIPHTPCPTPSMHTVVGPTLVPCTPLPVFLVTSANGTARCHSHFRARAVCTTCMASWSITSPSSWAC